MTYIHAEYVMMYAEYWNDMQKQVGDVHIGSCQLIRALQLNIGVNEQNTAKVFIL